jgi:hypothetical protein
MGKIRLEFKEEYSETPVSYWAHKEIEEGYWQDSLKHNPPLPIAIPCKGFPVLIVETQGIELEFASVPEMEHFLEVISQKNMPTTNQLARARGLTGGANRHWLSRLPAKLKPWNKREKLIPFIKKGISELSAVYTN